MHFDTKKYTKNYKMRIIQNTKRHDKLLSVKKIGKKSRGGPKIRSNLSKMRKFEKI